MPKLIPFTGQAPGDSLARLDSNEGMFFARELERINPMIFEERKPALNFLDLMPVKSDIPMHVEQYTFRTGKGFGEASFIGDYGSDFPVVNKALEETSTPYRLIGVAVEYSMLELQAAAALGRPLDSQLILEARRAIEEKVNSVAWYGDEAAGLRGLINHPEILSLAAANSIASGTTAADNLVELNKLANTIPNSTEQAEAADFAILPPDSYQEVSQQRNADGTDTSTLSYFLGTNGYITEAAPVRELRNVSLTGDASASDVAMAYKRDASCFELLYSGIQQLEIMRKGPMHYCVSFVAKVGGVAVYRPKSIFRLTGV